MVIQDITDKKHIEKEMERLERLNLIGEMAAGIGHEIRNPMTTVRGFLQIFSAREENSASKETFQLMIDELDRANQIITEFLSLSRDRTVDFKVVNINTIINVLYPLIYAHANTEDKRVEIQLGEIPDSYVDEKELRQLILNLTRNGLEAMSAGGKLTISTYMKHGKIVLVVEDQGCGIPNEIREKIGTPFFTTKENGTGLGMAICYSIAARHKATIDFQSNSTGTKVFVKFDKVNASLFKREKSS
jgi:signal transduction histidine kinase